ncbi:hypothetical protein HPULCUR_004907 [Helicostylum pulchrum]|uniref:GH16 domain-containing protein n=1 Tax=Helicostylum pulchrum TaxID=562976 RepID=A0ABP9XXK1_9FUNG
MLIRYVSLVVFGLLIVVKAQEEPTPNQNNNIQNADKPIVCDCGFIDENNLVWSNVWHADYGLYKSSLQFDRNYLVMDYTVSAKYKDTLDRIFSPGNVKLSKDDGITLSVQKESNGKYTSAAVGTKRSDFLYGTYRARMKTSNVEGTVAAFYFYRNDSCEIDIESLSKHKDPSKTYFAVQPQIYEPDGSASALTNEKHDLEFNPTNDYHEYRFDWTPEAVKFYIDNTYIREMTTNVPQSPGRILINHWTDGNPFFSGGPPNQDANLRISHLNLFFNSSETKDPPSCTQSKTPCSIADIMSRNILPESELTSMSNTKPAIPTYHSIIFFCLLVYFYA